MKSSSTMAAAAATALISSSSASLPSFAHAAATSFPRRYPRPDYERTSWQRRRRAHRNRRSRRDQEQEAASTSTSASDVDDSSTSTTYSSSSEQGATASSTASSAGDGDGDGEKEKENSIPASVFDFNKRIEACPGFEQLRGYASLSSLREDLVDYFDSFRASAPSISSISTSTSASTLAPIIAEAEGPPSASPSPSSPSVRNPSEMPSQQNQSIAPNGISLQAQSPPTQSPAPSTDMANSSIDFDAGVGEPSKSPTTPIENVVGGSRKRTRGHTNNNGGGKPSRNSRRVLSLSQEMMGHNAEEGGLFITSSSQNNGEQEETATSASRSNSHDTTSGGIGATSRSTNNLTPPPAVSFQICPNSQFKFETKQEILGIQWPSSSPLILETPLIHHPIEISCMMAIITGDNDNQNDSSRSCVFSEGDEHISIRSNRHSSNTPTEYYDNKNEEEEGKVVTVGTNSAAREQHYYPMTVSGITFRKSHKNSILMQDPRGEVVFRNCAWEDNDGAAVIMIDGRYDDSTEHDDDHDELDADEIIDHTNSGQGGDLNDMTTTTSNSSSLDLDNDAMATTDVSTVDNTPDSDSMGRQLLLHEEEEIMLVNFVEDETILIQQEKMMMQKRKKMRSLAMDAAPRATIAIENCLFSGNKGSTTIMVQDGIDDGAARRIEESQSSPEYQHPSNITNLPLVHSIHLSLEDTTFQMEHVETSLIENHGARIWSSRCSFVNNTSASIITSEYGTVAITNTEFMMNVLSAVGNDLVGSLVRLDEKSVLEANDDTCAKASNGESINMVEGPDVVSEVINEGNGLDSFNSGQRHLQQSNEPMSNQGNDTGTTDGTSGISDQDNTTAAEISSSASSIERFTAMNSTGVVAVSTSNQCEGIYVRGVCTSFGFCPTIPAINEEEPPKVEEELDECISNWGNLVTAVRDQPQKGQQDFIICNGATLLATDEPVVINADNVTIQCGKENENNCHITGGFSHFHITGSSKGVHLMRLIMKSSTGASIMALGTMDATLYLSDCKWVGNKGASVILIHNADHENGDGLDSTASATLGKTTLGTELDIMPMLKSLNRSMSVDVAHCTFRKNSLTFSTIANIGGTLGVSKSEFSENAGIGGDIVVSNKGSCTVQGSCFDASSSVAPGAIFVDSASVVSGNVDNFGFGITAGAYNAGDSNGGNTSATCTDIFQTNDDKGNDCLGSGTCTGSCVKFTATFCGLHGVSKAENAPVAKNATGNGAEQLQPSAAPSPSGHIYMPAYRPTYGESRASENKVPIIMATLVGVFILFGLCGIISRPPPKSSNAKRQESSGCCRCCKRGSGGGSTGSTDVDF